MTRPGRAGVLLMAHGTPASMDDMPAYLRLVRGGRAASPALDRLGRLAMPGSGLRAGVEPNKPAV